MLEGVCLLFRRYDLGEEVLIYEYQVRCLSSLRLSAFSEEGPHEAGAESTPAYGNALIEGPYQHATNFLTHEIIHKITREFIFKTKSKR